jgi:hypothetical protein
MLLSSVDVSGPVFGARLTVSSVNLEGEQTPIPFSTLIKRPDLRHLGSNIRYACINIRLVGKGTDSFW